MNEKTVIIRKFSRKSENKRKTHEKRRRTQINGHETKLNEMAHDQ